MRSLLGLGVALALSSMACAGGQSDAGSRTTLVLFDISGSTLAAEVRSAYAEGLDLILASVELGDTLMAGWISEQSDAELRLPISETFTFEPDTDNTLLVRAAKRAATEALEEHLGEIRTQMESLLRNPDRQVNLTDILGSLRLADRIFRAYPNDQLTLVLFSDMVHESAEFDMTRTLDTADDVQAALSQLQEARLIPDLRGVEVYVVGAQHADPRKGRVISQFWAAFFDASGADLRPERYGAVLLRFP